MNKSRNENKRAIKAAADRSVSVILRIMVTIVLIMILVGCLVGLYFFVLHAKDEINLWEIFREAFSLLFSCR